MGSSKKVTVGYRYYMGLQFGLCHGPVDALHEVVVGDRSAWAGTQAASGAIVINAPELFGGDKREGGIFGVLDVAMGEPTQTENSYLVSKLGAAIPAFRGILSAVWRGGQVSANNPYVKPWSFRVRRILQGWTGGTPWYPEKAEIVGYLSAPVVVTQDTALDALDADTVGANGITYALSPLDILIIEQTTGLTYEAVSRWSTDGNPLAGGLPWGCGFDVKTEDSVITSYRATMYTTAAAANAAAVAAGPVSISGHSSYTIFIPDVNPPDNRGGLSLKVSVSYASKDMNPAHIIYQCLTDTSWGMGYPTTAIDDASFTAAADTLFSEGFGLSLLWNKQDSIENFIKIVLDHIGGMLYVKPDTGDFALKLIRDDYDRQSLPQYGPDNLIAVDDYQRQAWGETVNEITVVYTDPMTCKDVPLAAQDAGNIRTQGGVVSQTRNYPGIRNSSLARRVALRDLQSVSTPLGRIKLVATRAAWQTFPGDVIRLSWPDYDINDVVYRIIEVNAGTLTDGKIIISAVEDVFGLPDNTYLAEQSSAWEDPTSEPAPAPYRKLTEAPYWDMVRSLSAADMAYVDSLSGYLETQAVRPSGDATNYSIWSRTGSADYVQRGNGDFCPTATITGALTKTTTALVLTGGIDLDLVEIGGYAIIDNEYVLVSALDWMAGTATISRGVLDTVPTEHAASSRIWFSDGFSGFETTEYADGETLDVKMRPITGYGELALAAAPVNSLTFDQRQYRPYPPGKVLVNTGIYPEWIDGQSELSVSWAHRDRLSQTAYLVEQSAGSIGPEGGVTYELKIFSETDTLIHTETTAGTSYTYPAAIEGVDSGLSSGGDFYWSNVVLQMHMNATNLGDVKGNAVTLVGNVVRSVTQSKFGGYSAYFDGTGDYLSIPSTADFAFGTGDFTVEAWVWLTTLTGTGTIFDFRPGANGAYLVISQTGGTLNYGVNNTNPISAAAAMTAGVWMHIAAARASNSLRMFVNGTQAGTTVTDMTNYATAPLLLGKNVFTTGLDLGGYMDDVRITKGVARYTKTFAVPSLEFPDSQGVGRDLNGRLRFELESERGGLVSYQKHNHTVLREGYGFNYGYYYGGQ